jgi:hypothetical protein
MRFTVAEYVTPDMSLPLTEKEEAYEISCGAAGSAAATAVGARATRAKPPPNSCAACAATM